MARKLLAGLALLAIVGAVVVFRPVGAQDNTDARLDALETRVAALEAQSGLAPTVSAPVASGSAQVATPTTGRGVVVTGVGSSVTDDFRLPTGMYVVTVEWKSGCCISVDLWGNRALPIEITYGIAEDGGRVESIYVAGTEVVGGVFLEVKAVDTDAAWTITFEPR